MKVVITGGTGFVGGHLARALAREGHEIEPAPPCDPLPADLTPRRPFSPEQIRAGLPEPGPFGLRDLRCCT